MATDAVSLKAVKPISNGALKSEDLPSRIKVLNWGVNKTLDGEILFDEESAKVFYANQRNIGRTYCPLDFNHNTVKGTQAYEDDKEPRAIAGYGVPTIYPGDGLWYEYMCYTPNGNKSARDYADLSPAVITDANNRVIGLHSTALTPAGAIDNLSFYSADNVPALMKKCASEVCDPNLEMEEEEKGAKKGKKSEIKTDELEDQAALYNKVEHIHANSADKPYGDVEYADPSHGKYPINTEAHVRAALSYINMPKNQKGYTATELSAIKRRIASKAKSLGIELKAESAVKITPNAYVQDPYKGIDDMNEEHMKFFKAELGLGDDANPDDVMKMLRAKLEGLKTTKNPLPHKTPGIDETVAPGYDHRGGPAGLTTGEEGTPTGGGTTPHGTITYSAEEQARMDEEKKKEKAEKRKAEMKALAAEVAAEMIKPFSAEFDAMKAEKASNAKALEATKKQAIIDEAGRAGKVIPLSAEEISELSVKTLESMVAKLPSEVPTQRASKVIAASAEKVEGDEYDNKWIRAFSANGRVKLVPELRGARARTAQYFTEYFANYGKNGN